MVDLILSAIPAFILLLVVEALSFHLARHDDHGEVGYEARDTRTSLTMGIGNVVINLGWKGVVLATYAALYAITPLRLDAGDWWTWVLLFFADDFAYYWYHRAGHECACCGPATSSTTASEHYNLSTALRQTWTPLGGIVFWAWLPLRRLRAVDDPAGDELEPALPVLDPHRADRQAPAADRVGLQHAQPPPRPPRLAGAVPGQELRRHPDHLGPHARHLRAARASACATA